MDERCNVDLEALSTALERLHSEDPQKPTRIASSKLKGLAVSADQTLPSRCIELLDIRFKRINYNEAVRLRIYERMISERQQIAERTPGKAVWPGRRD